MSLAPEIIRSLFILSIQHWVRMIVVTKSSSIERIKVKILIYVYIYIYNSIHKSNNVYTYIKLRILVYRNNSLYTEIKLRI